MSVTNGSARWLPVMLAAICVVAYLFCPGLVAAQAVPTDVLSGGGAPGQSATFYVHDTIVQGPIGPMAIGMSEEFQDGFWATIVSVDGDCIHLDIPDTLARPGEYINVPVYIDDVSGWGIVAYDMQICWCDEPAGLLDYQYCFPGNVTPPTWFMNCNPCSDNCVTVAAAGTDALSGEGVLFYLRFRVSVNAKPCMCCDIRFREVNVYDPENALVVCTDDGEICVESCTISGTLNSWKCCIDECEDLYRVFPEVGARVHLEDCDGPVATTFTDSAGFYIFECIDPADSGCPYCLDVDLCEPKTFLINSFDASLILQYLVCLDELDDCPFFSMGAPVFPQMVAADVSCAGGITSYDASLILQYVTRLIDDFPCAEPISWYPLGWYGNCIYECPGVLDWIGVLKGDVSPYGGCPPVAPAPAAEVVVNLGMATDLGDRIEVPIVVTGASGIFSGDYELTYDAVALSVISVVPGGLAAGSMSAFNPEDGDLTIAMAAPASYGGDGEVAVITFGKNTPSADLSSVSITSVFFNDGWPDAEIGASAGITDVTYETRLGPVAPNPFREGTTISYQMATSSDVSLSVYNVNGQLVRTLVDGTVGPGTHTVVWTGQDDFGARVARGVYFCRMYTESFRSAVKIVLLD